MVSIASIKDMSNMDPNELENYYAEINENTRMVSGVISSLNRDMESIREKARQQAEDLLRQLEMTAAGETIKPDPESYKELAMILRAGLLS